MYGYLIDPGNETIDERSTNGLLSVNFVLSRYKDSLMEHEITLSKAAVPGSEIECLSSGALIDPLSIYR